MRYALVYIWLVSMCVSVGAHAEEHDPAEQHVLESLQLARTPSPPFVFFGDASCPYVPLASEGSKDPRPDRGCAAVAQRFSGIPIAIKSDAAKMDAEARARCAALSKGRGVFVLNTVARGFEPADKNQPSFLDPRTGRSMPLTGPMPLDQVEFVGCGVHFPVLSGLPIASFDVVGRRLIAIHAIQRTAQGRYFGGQLAAAFLPFVSVLDLETYAVDHPALGDELVRSIAVAPGPAAKISIWRDQGSDQKAWQCVGAKCTPIAKIAAPQGSYLEATAVSGYRIEARGELDPPGEAVRRTLRYSPDRSAVAYLTSTPAQSDHPHRKLWIQRLPQGKPVLVAEGSGFFHARWLDSSKLLFETDVSETALLTEQIKWQRRQQPCPEGEVAMCEQVLRTLAVHAIRGATGSDAGAYYERLAVYDLGAGTKAPFLPDDHLRLIGHETGAVADLPPRDPFTAKRGQLCRGEWACGPKLACCPNRASQMTCAVPCSSQGCDKDGCIWDWDKLP